MISLGGLGAAPGGFQSAQARMYELAKTLQDQQSMAAYGQALQALAQQQGGQGPIPGLPQQGMPQQAPMRPPQGMPPPFTANTQLAALPGPTGSQGVDDLTQALLRKTGNATPSAGGQIASGFGAQGFGPSGSVPAQPPPTQVAAAGGPAAPPSVPQQTAQPQIRLPSTAGVQPGTLTWPVVVNAIKQANPKITPQALAGAVNNFLPLMDRENQDKWKAIAEERLSKADEAKATADAQDVGDIVDQIEAGEFPPPGASGSSARYPSALNGAIAQELAKRGFNLSAHVSDWNAMQKMIAAQNSRPTVQFIGAIDSADTFLDTFKTNIDQWNAANLPTFVNDGILKIRESNIIPDAAAQKQAALIKSQYAELVNLIGSVFQSGGVPTDAARKLAAEQLNLGWSRGTIDAVIDQIKGLLADRKAAIRGVAPVTPGGAPNSYIPAPAAKPGASSAPQAAPAAGPKPGDIREGNGGIRYQFKGGDQYDQKNWVRIDG